jgi:hypothetical protein
LKKRTSINSIPKIHKEKEMADFRKWLFAFAVVALLAGLTVPASAQGTSAAVVCTVQSATNNLIRTQGYTEQVGDVVIQCTGGTPTQLGQPIPPVDIQVFLSLNVTSQITALGPTISGAPTANFLDALLIIDDPNSPINPTAAILNCGSTGTTQNPTSGPGVCTMQGLGPLVGNSSPNTYNPNVEAGHPNVFQGRQALNGLAQSSVVFNGVPFDPPGTATRLLRFTNIRVNATQLGVSSPTTQIPVTMGITSSGSASLPLSFVSLDVATAQSGVTVISDSALQSFAQCLPSFASGATNLFSSSHQQPFATCTPSTLGLVNEAPCTGTGTSVNTSLFATSNGTTTPGVRFNEGFSSSWKAKNIAESLANGSATTGAFIYGSGTSSPVNYGQIGAAAPTSAISGDVDQNVPGVNYFSESGFEFIAGLPFPTAFGQGVTTTLGGINQNGSTPFNTGGETASTGITSAGVATQGTRLALQVTNVPQGLSIFVPPVIFLYRQGVSNSGASSVNNGNASGVAVLTLPQVAIGGTVSTAGDGLYLPPSALTGAGAGALTNLYNAFTSTATSGSTFTLVYEILFTDPFSNEFLDVPLVVAFSPALSSNLPLGFPAPGVTAAFQGGFAPFYTTAAAGFAEPLGTPASTAGYPIPRFLFQGSGGNLFLISRCACNLLWPFVTQQAGFDTGIAIANTSADNLNNGTPVATPQEGLVTIWYYGTVGTTGPPPPFQTSTVPVPAGQVMTFTLSQGNVTQWGIDNRGANFQGYLITTAQFQYCHGFAFISSLVAGPTSTGLSEGYLALVLDAATFVRGSVIGEALAQ